MANKNRDDFSPKTRLRLSQLAGGLCSYPSCRTPTVGATSDGEAIIDIGTAAHICAASPGGPRYDVTMTQEERSSDKNGIWMCRDHGKAIDSKDPEFTVERLRQWKKEAEHHSWQRVLRNDPSPMPVSTIDGELLKCIRLAAEADLKVFKQTTKWPITSVALTLEVEGFNEPITTSALAGAVTSLDDLILVAPPGMGKTTTLFQIAEGVLANDNCMPMMVLLGEWATEGVSILESILNRPAFKGVSEDDIRKAAASSGVVLLLDGWNELDYEARKRARVQIAKLKAELPDLGLVVSTRKQELDVPFEGKRIDLLPLNEDQQMQIADVMRGDVGMERLDQAWRTVGLRELVTIPLYLTALLSLPENAPFPTTKEEVLRHFVAAHEEEAGRAEALRAIAHGFQLDYLEGLAVYATQTESTSVDDRNARRLIYETEALLEASGQITNKSQPNDLLDVLVSNHVLMRAGDMPGYTFQHQQFQEWYASHLVERLIITAVDDPNGREKLKEEVFNLPVWEESILFAVERLAHGSPNQIFACGKAIILAFEVDPMLSAEMIFRATEKVWEVISIAILERVARWHVPGEVDRAFRFMLTSGRSEFLDAVWPLITNENDQISFNALRSCRQFRTSILGKDANKKIATLSQKVRTVLLEEIASNSGIDGLDLASEIAKDDKYPGVQASVVEALAFRRADRHVALVLQNASEKTYDLIVRKDLIDEVSDEHVKKGVAEARGRLAAVETSSYDRLRAIVYAKDEVDRSAELNDIISSIEIVRRQDFEVLLIYEARKRYPHAVANGLLARVRTGRSLFFGADDILASSGLILEDNALLQIAMADPPGDEMQAKSAASVLGPLSTGLMIDALLDVATKLHDANGKYEKTANDRYYVIKDRIDHVLGTSLVAAIKERSAHADNEKMSRLAILLTRDLNLNSDRSRPFDTENIAAIRVLSEDWGNRMLASGNAKRHQLLNIATLISHVPNVSLLPLLKRMLDDNILRYRQLREEAESTGWRNGNAVDGARWPMMHEYQRIFLTINAPETSMLMHEYLVDPFFGEFAAGILASQWESENESPPTKQYFSGVDFSRIKEKRALLSLDPTATTSEADAIFAVVESLLTEDATKDQKKQAIMLGAVAMRLPHGERDETIKKLIDMTSWRERSKLLLNLALSGAELDSKYVEDGLKETLEAAKKEPWLITQSDGFEIRQWIQLFPFTNRTADSLQVLQILPDDLRHPHLLEGLVNGLVEMSSEGGEEVLFKLAEQDSRFYQHYHWRASVLKLGTASASLRLIDLTVNGAFSSESFDEWHWSREISVLIAKYPEVRNYVYAILKDGVTSPTLALLARAVSESPDTEGLLLLLNIQNKQKQSFLGRDTIEKVTTEHVPAENWSGAYNIVPAPVIDLRKRLLAMTTDGGPTDAASQYLNLIDAIRDEHGIPLSEPRHPDIASGKLWPLMPPNGQVKIE